MESRRARDLQLVVELKNGNREALNELDQQYRTKIIQVLMRMIHNYQDAEDIYQEALLKAVTHIDSFKATGDFYNWLYTIAVNQCRDSLRRKKTSPIANRKTPETAAASSTCQDPLRQLERQEIHAKIADAIAKLPPRQQQIVQLRLFDSLKYTQIAEEIGGNSATIKALFCKARQYLKGQLQSCLATFAMPYHKLSVAKSQSAGLLRNGVSSVQANGAVTSVSFLTAMMIHLIAIGLLWNGYSTNGGNIGETSSQQLAFISTMRSTLQHTARSDQSAPSVQAIRPSIRSAASPQLRQKTHPPLPTQPQVTATLLPVLTPSTAWPVSQQLRFPSLPLADTHINPPYLRTAKTDGRQITHSQNLPINQAYAPYRNRSQAIFSGPTRPALGLSRFLSDVIPAHSTVALPSSSVPRTIVNRITEYMRIHVHHSDMNRSLVTVERGGINYPIRPIGKYAEKYLWTNIADLQPQTHTPIADREALFQSPIVFWFNMNGWDDGTLVVLTSTSPTFWYNPQGIIGVRGTIGKVTGDLSKVERVNLRDYLLCSERILIAIAPSEGKAESLREQVLSIFPELRFEKVFLSTPPYLKHTNEEKIIDSLNATRVLEGIWVNGQPVAILAKVDDNRLVPDVLEILTRPYQKPQTPLHQLYEDDYRLTFTAIR